MRRKYRSLFCPFCNARGRAQPVLSFMTASPCVYAPEWPFGVAWLLVRYRCERCGFCEIHTPRVSSAA